MVREIKRKINNIGSNPKRSMLCTKHFNAQGFTLIRTLRYRNLVNAQAGFTLIELLVVIAIIGILLALSAFGLQGSRANSRDAKRKADLETIRSGMEMYKSDCNQYPPTPLPNPGQPLVGTGISGCLATNKYIEVMPGDPLEDWATRHYSYQPSGSPRSSYTLCAALEGSTATPAGCASCGSQTCRYKAINP